MTGVMEEIQARAAASGATCSCCGRPLTSLESIAVGMGSVCRSKIQSTLGEVDRFGRPRAEYVIVDNGPDVLLIKDVGPWDIRPTVTNVVESVVEELAEKLNGRKLHYIDSEGDLAEIVVKRGRFDSFRPLPSEQSEPTLGGQN